MPPADADTRIAPARWAQMNSGEQLDHGN